MRLSLLPVLLPFLVRAAPSTRPDNLLAVAPEITEPNQFSIWTTGSQEQVKWVTDQVPPEAQQYTVDILLGFLQDGSENLNATAAPLAQKLPIMQGNATITVPSDIATRDDYIVVLIGDSGNRSPTFAILHT